MSRIEEGRERGRKAGKNAKQMVAPMKAAFKGAIDLYPTMAGLDLATAIRDYDRERLSCYPDYAKFPEMCGLLDRHIGERQGFVEASGLASPLAETVAAFNYSWHFFLSRRVNARHLARYDIIPPVMCCTNVFFPQTAEGGVVISDNRDDLPRYPHIPDFRIGPPLDTKQVAFGQGGVSSACLLDEEPVCSFPCNPFELMPPECREDIHEAVKFMARYREFYGPGNQIWCDTQLRAVSVEKSTCRVAFRWPTVKGAACIGACSYLDPELNAFKKSRTRLAMAIKGETEETCPDWQFFEGCDQHHRRLIRLMNEEAQRGATLWGAFNIVADHDVPYPERICLAGEKLFDDKEPNAMWTLTQHAVVVTGPNRRALYRSLQDMKHPKPIYTYTPKFVLGEGVKMKPEWQKDVAAGRCTLVAEQPPAAGRAKAGPAPKTRHARR